MAVVASGPDTEILQFDLFHKRSDISRIAHSGWRNLKKPCLCRIKVKIFSYTHEVKMY